MRDENSRHHLEFSLRNNFSLLLTMFCMCTIYYCDKCFRLNSDSDHMAMTKGKFDHFSCEKNEESSQHMQKLTFFVLKIASSSSQKTNTREENCLLINIF